MFLIRSPLHTSNIFRPERGAIYSELHRVELKYVGSIVQRDADHRVAVQLLAVGVHAKTKSVPSGRHRLWEAVKLARPVTSRAAIGAHRLGRKRGEGAAHSQASSHRRRRCSLMVKGSNHR